MKNFALMRTRGSAAARTSFWAQAPRVLVHKNMMQRGFTLIELIVAVGLFAVVMTLASGAYLLMINVNRQTQSITTGINNLSFALQTMTYKIRTGTAYNCATLGDCNAGISFSFRSSEGPIVTYTRVVDSNGNGKIQETTGATVNDLTDPSVNISSLTFYASGTKSEQGNDLQHMQPRVTIIIKGTVPSGPVTSEPFTVETGATMRGSDL